MEQQLWNVSALLITLSVKKDKLIEGVREASRGVTGAKQGVTVRYDANWRDRNR
jgi:hypothetical protein